VPSLHIAVAPPGPTDVDAPEVDPVEPELLETGADAGMLPWLLVDSVVPT
jgi:hypothetical protein